MVEDVWIMKRNSGVWGSGIWLLADFFWVVFPMQGSAKHTVCSWSLTLTEVPHRKAILHRILSLFIHDEVTRTLCIRTHAWMKPLQFCEFLEYIRNIKYCIRMCYSGKEIPLKPSGSNIFKRFIRWLIY